MSTFTTIRTLIRDTATMYKVLQSIPGAQIERNAILPIKGGGYGRFDFQVTLPKNRAFGLSGLFGKLVRDIDLQYFVVYRGDDGRLCIEINQDQVAHRSIETLVDAALRPVEQEVQREQAEREQRKEQQLEELRRVQQEQQAKAEEEGRLREAQMAEEARLARQQVDERRARQMTAAEEEAERVVRAMGEERSRATAAAPSIAQPTDGRDAVAAGKQQAMEQELSAALAQEYAKEKVLAQLDDIHAQYGVALGGVETLQDGTIEITLRG